MESVDRVVFYLFILSLVLVALAYYVGLTSDAPAIASSIRSIIYAATGRNTSGSFAGYPAKG